MKNLKKAAIEYADREVLQPWGLPNETLKRYAIQDFTAAATWYKENSKEKEMLEVLEELIEYGANNGMAYDLYEKINKLVNQATIL